MQIVFYTPPLQRDNRSYTYVPHLVEHCVWRDVNFSLEDHFLYNVELRNGYALQYSTYTSGDDMFASSYLDYISKPLQSEIITKEKEILAKEIETYDDIKDSIQKTIEFDLYSTSYSEDEFIDISNKEVIEYHQFWYQKEYALIIDEEFNIITSPTKRHDVEKNNDENIINKPIEFNWTSGTYKTASNTNRKAFYKLLFIKEAINECTTYTLRYKDIAEYAIPLCDRFITKDYRVVGIPPEANSNLSKEFFTIFKKYFIDNIFVQYDTAEFAYFNLIEKWALTKERIIEHIQSFEQDVLD